MHRLLEILICVIAGMLLMPFFVLACGAVLVLLGRPLFFSQVRAGRNGVPFRLVKLRSMHSSRDAQGALLPDAARQTRITALIRRLRLDELPQLALILRGRMALVGPRPLLPETIAAFGEAGRRRGRLRPGLTGWAQVSGNTLLADREKLQLDLWYVHHRSARLDLRILGETIGVALGGERRRPRRLAAAARWLQAQQPGLGLGCGQEVPA
ncbi:MAG: sugar transferase [Rhodobacteraceae bacterium]|nr:sugar transferase [Paracoccaceae bacterium]